MTLTNIQIATLLEQHRLGPLRNWRQMESDRCRHIYLVNGDIVLRVNAREPGSTKFRKEAAIYRQLCGTPLPVPQVLGLDISRRTVPYDVLMLERLEGRNGMEVWSTLDQTAREQLSYDMGHWLATVHTQRYGRYGGYDERTRQLGTSDNWRSYLLDKAAESLIALWQCEGLPAALLYGVEDYLMRATIPTRPTPVLVHGDFGLHNVLLARDGRGWRVSGLFDFEWALVGDAEYEFATGLLVEPDEVNPLPSPFLQGYRSVRPMETGWERRSAVYRLIYHLALCAAVWQSYSGDPFMLRYHRGMIVDILKAGV